MPKLIHKLLFKNPFLLILSLIAFSYLMFLAQANGDFKVFLGAADLLKEKKNIYNAWIQTGANVTCLYYYSPLFALILVPFTYLPFHIPNILWQIGGIVWVIRCWQLIELRFDLRAFSGKEKRWFMIISFILVFRFLLYNFDLIQMTIFLLWVILESINLFEMNKNISGGLLLALAINIKLLPVVIVPYLIYRQRFFPAFVTIVFSIIFLLLPAIFIGWHFNNFLLNEWWGVINPAHSEHLMETGLGVHSLTALIPSLLMQTEGELDFKRNILNLSPETVNSMVHATRFIFIAWTLYFLGLKPKKQITHHQTIWEISYIAMIIPLIFPHQQKYAFFLLLPASAYIVYFLLFTYKFNLVEFGRWKWKIILMLICLAFILMTLTTDGIIGRHYNKITQHLKLITYGTILMAVLLTICHPKYLSKKITENPEDC